MNFMRRYSSGQRGQTVNLLASAYGGSNPPRRTVQLGMQNPDMTPVPRLADRTVRLYLPGRTVTASEIIGDEGLINN